MPISAAGISREGFIRSAVARGLSANATLESLRAGSLGYRRTDFLSDFRELSTRAAVDERLRFVRRDRAPDPAELPEASTTILRRYSYEVRLRGFDPFSGEQQTRYVTVSSSDPLTREVIEDDALGFLEVSEGDSGLPLGSPEALLISGRRSGAAGSLLSSV